MTAVETDISDQAHMRSALTLAARGLGTVAPNPAVGCIVTNSAGQIVGRGWTAPGGRPHAETIAIDRAGDQCRGGTAYVSLEPCDHQGQTPPCSKALIEAGISRVVVACTDPDPRVGGKGIKTLRDAGIEVKTGVCEGEARELNAGFFLTINQDRPLITLKAATTLDGRIATASGASKWITGAGARAAGHMLRASHDALMVGIGTVLADDPALDCRLSGMEDRSPLPVIADSQLRLPETARILDRNPVILTGRGVDSDKSALLEDRGATVIDVQTDSDGRPQVQAMAEKLAELGLTRVMIEGGGILAGAFMASGLIDRLEWFMGSKIFGDDGLPAVAGFGLMEIENAPTYTLTSCREIAGDLHHSYRQNL